MSISKWDSFDILKSITQNMMGDAIDVYLNPEEPLRDQDDHEEDAILSSWTEFQKKFNQLQERYITLKTMTGSLKDQISLEKEEWRKELKATAQTDVQLRRKARHECGDRWIMNEEDYRKRMELFKDFMFFQRATDNLGSITWKNNYQNWLLEVESKCNLELSKIQDSIKILKPLKDVASKWGKQEVQRGRKCTCGASGDASDSEVETVPVKETGELKIDHN